MNEVNSVDPEKTTAELMVLIDKMTKTMLRFDTDQLNKYDLSPNRYNALRLLAENGSLTMSALADELHVSTAAVTSIVDKLEKERLVRRVRDKKDRRQIFVQVTPSGGEAVKRVIDLRASLLRYLLENMAPEMRENWIELYREIGVLIERKVAETAAAKDG